MKKNRFYKKLKEITKELDSDKAEKKAEDMKNKQVQELLFDSYIQKCKIANNSISNYFELI